MPDQIVGSDIEQAPLHRPGGITARIETANGRSFAREYASREDAAADARSFISGGFPEYAPDSDTPPSGGELVALHRVERVDFIASDETTIGD